MDKSSNDRCGIVANATYKFYCKHVVGRVYAAVREHKSECVDACTFGVYQAILSHFNGLGTSLDIYIPMIFGYKHINIA